MLVLHYSRPLPPETRRPEGAGARAQSAAGPYPPAAGLYLRRVYPVPTEPPLRQRTTMYRNYSNIIV